MSKLGRREFITLGSESPFLFMGAALMGAELTGPAQARAQKATFPQTSCGTAIPAKAKVLVAYASRTGSTGGVAQSIADELCKTGVTVDLRLMRQVKDLTPYNGVVLGSAIRSDEWLPEAMDFVMNNQSPLSRIPGAYFLVCLTLYKRNPRNLAKARSFLGPVLQSAPAVKPLDIGLFPGELNYAKLGFITRMVMRSKMKERGVPEGDFRDWPAIQDWAGGLTAKLGLATQDDALSTLTRSSRSKIRT